MKAISVILQCYNRRLELVKIEPQVNEIKEYIDTVKRAAREIESKEKALQVYLGRRNLTIDEIYMDPDESERVF